jgi:ankyrin repeat protein
MAIACSGSCSEKAVQLLLTRSPELIDERDNKGRLPLHLAAIYIVWSEKALQMLFGIRRHALRVPDDDGRLPLHAAIASAGAVWDAKGNVMQLIQQGPDTLKVKDNCGMLPLHVAVAQRYPSYHVIEKLVKANPTALQVVDSSGRLPIHVVLSNSKQSCPSLDLIQLLVEPTPNSLLIADARGMYPLHILLHDHKMNSADRKGVCDNCLSVASYLAEICLPAIELADRSGRLPRREELLHVLVRATSDSCKRRDNDGRLPLHLAPRVSWKAVGILAAYCPQSVQVRDRDGCYPVHLALLATRRRMCCTDSRDSSRPDA